MTEVEALGRMVGVRGAKFVSGVGVLDETALANVHALIPFGDEGCNFSATAKEGFGVDLPVGNHSEGVEFWGEFTDVEIFSGTLRGI